MNKFLIIISLAEWCERLGRGGVRPRDLLF